MRHLADRTLQQRGIPRRSKLPNPTRPKLIQEWGERTRISGGGREFQRDPAGQRLRRKVPHLQTKKDLWDKPLFKTKNLKKITSVQFEGKENKPIIQRYLKLEDLKEGTVVSLGIFSRQQKNNYCKLFAKTSAPGVPDLQLHDEFTESSRKARGTTQGVGADFVFLTRREKGGGASREKRNLGSYLKENKKKAKEGSQE